MATLNDALAWAARGFRVFPLVALAKTPAVASFQTVATTDPLVIAAWWRDPVTFNEQDYNVGVLTTDMVVVDIDVKNGKPGMDSYAALGGHYDTLVVKTPTGGFHCYFNGPDSKQAIDLRPGLDIRSHNNYVIAPGSYVIDPEKGIAGEYTVWRDQPPTLIPDLVRAELQAPNQRRERDDTIELDTPTAVNQAIFYLRFQAPVATEGQGGDNATYQVAARVVRDYALTVETAYQLMQENWNERCSPPWGNGELWKKVENADEYASGQVGAQLAESYFKGVEIPAIQVAAKPDGLYFGNAPNPQDIPPRPWVIERLLMRQSVSLLVAMGGAGKSMINLILAAHMAVGKSLGSYKITRCMKCVVFNAEDDLDEQARRLLAICMVYQLDYKAVRENIMLIDTRLFQILLAQNVNGTVVTNESHIAYLIQLMIAPDIDVGFLDPLIEVHGCNENDPVQMRQVMNILKRICREANIAMMLTHHGNKPQAGKTRAGDADISRGSTAIVNAARLVLTLVPPDERDCEDMAIPPSARRDFVRLDDAKTNASRMSYEGNWFRWESVKLYNGDNVGALAHADMREAYNDNRHALAELLREAIVMSGEGAISLATAAQHVATHDPLYAKLPATTIRRRIEQTFSRPVKIDEDILVIERITTGNRDQVLLRLT